MSKVIKDILHIRTSRTDKVVYGVLIVRNGSIVEGVWKIIENRVKLFPPGIYPIRFEYSPRFDRKLWELHDVPNRSEIKIHVANYFNQLIGCIGIGKSHQDLNADGIIDLAYSKVALEDFHTLMEGITETKIKTVEVY